MKQSTNTEPNTHTVEYNKHRSDANREEQKLEFEGISAKSTRICLFGLKDSGKDGLCNVLYGDKTHTKFVEASAREYKPHLTQVERTNWLDDKDSELVLIDACEFNDLKVDDSEIIHDLNSHLKEFKTVTQFLIVLSSMRFSDPFCNMINRISTTFGQNVFKYTSIVFTQWETSKRAERMRQSQNVSRDMKSPEINKLIKLKTGYDTDSARIPCFFVDTNVFCTEEYQKFYEEQEISNLKDEIQRLKERCLNQAEDYSLTNMIKKDIKAIYAEIMETRKIFIGKVERYFDSRDQNCIPSLFHDVIDLVEKFEAKNSPFHIEDNYRKKVDAELSRELPKAIKISINAIWKQMAGEEFPGKFANLGPLNIAKEKKSGIIGKVFGGLTFDTSSLRLKIASKVTQEVGYNQGFKSNVFEAVGSYFEKELKRRASEC